MLTLALWGTLLALFASFYYLGALLLRLPSRRAERALQLTVLQHRTLSERLFTALVKPLIEPLAQIIPLRYESQVELQAGLRQVGIALSAREYYARAILIGIYSLPVLLIVPLLGLPSPYLLVVGALPFVLFRHFSTEHSDRLAAKRQQIRRILPSFVRTVLYSLADKEDAIGDEIIGRANLVAIFSNYLEACPEVIRYELSLLITEMQSYSVETGIRRFGERLGLPMVTYLCDILIGVSKGQPHADALRILAMDIDIQGREALRAELQKRPGEMRRATVVLVILGMLVVLYVLIADLMGSWGFFG